MGERNADNADLAVLELKKKARRRLVGAIVLALAAAVILPLLLEKEPKPLGDDVSVQIPPIDEGKFVNRLTGRASDTKSSPKPATKVEPKAEREAQANATAKSDTAAVGTNTPAAASAPEAGVATPAPAAKVPATPAPSNVGPPKKSLSEAEQRVLMPATKATVKGEVSAEAASGPDAARGATPMPAAPVPALATAAPSVTPPAASPPPLAPKAEPAGASPTKNEGFAVQIAAFTDDKGANALAAKLKKAGFASTYVEPVETSRGTLWRVRIGGYSARAEADAARAKLKADGWNGIVVMAK